MSRIRWIASFVTMFVSMAAVSTGFGQYAGIAKHREHEAAIPSQLARFDASDFDVLAHQKWERLTEKHTGNVTVHWPDGRRVRGLEKHVRDVKAVFGYAPDARVRGNRVKFGSEEWTCVISQLEGTFTRPWRSSEGKLVQPNGRRFTIAICTVRHWNKKRLIDEEYLFWDEHSLRQQLGLVK